MPGFGGGASAGAGAGAGAGAASAAGSGFGQYGQLGQLLGMAGGGGGGGLGGGMGLNAAAGITPAQLAENLKKGQFAPQGVIFTGGALQPESKAAGVLGVWGPSIQFALNQAIGAMM